MAVCDQLEIAREERERWRDRLAVAALERLTAPTDTWGKVSQRDVKFFVSHSDRIVTKPERMWNICDERF